MLCIRREIEQFEHITSRKCKYTLYFGNFPRLELIHSGKSIELAKEKIKETLIMVLECKITVVVVTFS